MWRCGKPTKPLQALIQSSPLAIIALDPSGNVKVWSKAAERIFGWSAHEVIGRSLPIVPDGKQDEFRALRERVVRGEQLNDVEARRRRKDGSPIEVRISAAPLYDSKGMSAALWPCIADYTEQKKLEEQLRQAQKMEAVEPARGRRRPRFQ